MTMRSTGLSLLVPLALLSACASSHAEPIAVSADDRQMGGRYEPPAADPLYEPPPPRYEAPPPASYPYDVELTDAGGRRLRTYGARGRSYVLGTVGERYRLHITNHSSRRVEAVVSIDGLDAIDGRTADFVHKRGYLIAPYADVTVDGFRTSLDDVATFRFSSVRDSYAGRKGQDRNVGVIGVAFFPERPRPPQRPVYVPRPSRADEGYDDRAEAAPSRAPAPAPRAPGAAGGSAEKSAGAAPPAAAADAPRTRAEERPGLGTEFGERRSSHAEFTRFERESETTPAAVVELRYDDRAGLLALGVPVDEPPPSDTRLRETADPFPVNRFATPPPSR